MPRSPRVEIINTGSELLLGQVVNTHLPKIASALFPLGLRISRQTAVPDGSAIRPALIESFPRSDILIITGGLGPTSDDTTREITAQLLGRKLIENPEITTSIKERLASRGKEFLETMRCQAMVPEGATILPNPHGTAPGLYIPPSVSPWRTTPHLFLLPGPPRELLPMLENHVLPILHKISGDQPTSSMRTYHIVGIGESWVQEKIGHALFQRGDIEVGYCARPNQVDLRLIAQNEVLNEVEPLIIKTLGDYLVSKQGEHLEHVIVAELRQRGLRLSTAESCTGGHLANIITNVPGASDIFTEGFITYSNEAKIKILQVPPTLISKHGAVSAPVATAMAEGALHSSNPHFALAITGIAGPSGGTPEKPVGTVFIALAEQGQPTAAYRFNHRSDRTTFKDLTVQSALDLLRRRLLNLPNPTRTSSDRLPSSANKSTPHL